MKPIVILKVNIGEGEMIPLEVLYNDENYFKDIIEGFCKNYPQCNSAEIKDFLYKWIKKEVKEVLAKKNKKKLEK